MVIDENTPGVDIYLLISLKTRQVVGMVKRIDTDADTVTRLVPSVTTKGFDEITEPFRANYYVATRCSL